LHALDRSEWTYIGPAGGVDGKGSTEESLIVMHDLASNPNLNAIIPVLGGPMFDFEGWKEFVTTYANLTLVVGDAISTQIELLELGFVNGLVGQLPSEMGRKSVHTLVKVLNKEETQDTLAEQDPMGTNFLKLLQIPVRLPDVQLKNNFLGRLKIISYVLFTIVCASVFALGTWTYQHSNSKVVQSSQPIFLYLILVGALLMSATILTLTIDNQHYSTQTCTVACNLNIWFLATGFTLVFAALFSKSWRLNRIIKESTKLERARITVKDVLLPLVALLGANIAVLLSWTIHAHLKYVAKIHDGTDAWNRPMSYYGVCDSEFSEYYASAMFLVAFCPLLMALIQAYETRTFRTAFNESSYIGIVTVCIIQAAVIGVLLFVLTRDQPRVMIPLISLIIFFVSMAILLFIFIPKIVSYDQEVRMQKKRKLTETVSSMASMTRYGVQVAARSKEVFNTNTDLRGDSVFNLSKASIEEAPLDEGIIPEEEKTEFVKYQG
jgi:hypothetical protein